VRKVLLVSPTLRLGGAARRLTLLADALRDECELHIALLGSDTPAAGALRATGATVHTFPWPDDPPTLSPFALRSIVALHRLVKTLAPVQLHAWGRLPLAALLLGGARPATVTVSEALPPGRLGWLDTRMVRTAGRVVAHGIAQRERYRNVGVRLERLVTLPNAVEVSPLSPPGRLPAIPDDARVILCIGPVEQHKGFREAVWTFDIVRHAVAGVHLAIVGPGSQRRSIERFARDLQVDDSVHLPGPVDDLAPWLARAELVWVPSLRPCGVNAALEAAAAGKPVLGSALPELAEVIRDGETGILVKPGDKANLGRATRRLLLDADERQRMGDAARRWAEGIGNGAFREAVRGLYGAAFAVG
jgi:glycosyltransferase involved in cell wall biosynthesis